jgi:hypothetical protein
MRGVLTVQRKDCIKLFISLTRASFWSIVAAPSRDSTNKDSRTAHGCTWTDKYRLAKMCIRFVSTDAKFERLDKA